MAKAKRTATRTGEAEPGSLPWWKRLWSVSDIAPISDGAWARVSVIAAVIGLAATGDNFFMVLGHAIHVATEAPPFRDVRPGLDAVALMKHAVNVTIVGGQVLAAGMLQLGTDFGLLFAAGLAASKARITPTAALVLWGVCALFTLTMKFDIYEDVAAKRQAYREEAALEAFRAAEPADVRAARRLLAGYEGEAAKAVPPSQAASAATIEAADARLSDLAVEREEKARARAAEAETGRATRYGEFDAEVQRIDGELAVERARAEAARIALAERADFDAAATMAAAADRETPPAVQPPGYDGAFMQALRVFGPSLLSLIAILTAFAADKAAEDRRKEAAEFARRSEAAKRGAETRANAPVNAQYTEILPEERWLPAPTGEAAGPVAEADMARRVKPDGRHPDAHGDGLSNVTDTGEPPAAPPTDPQADPPKGDADDDADART